MKNIPNYKNFVEKDNNDINEENARETFIDKKLMDKLYPDTGKFNRDQIENMKLVRMMLLTMNKEDFDDFAKKVK